MKEKKITLVSLEIKNLYNWSIKGVTIKWKSLVIVERKSATEGSRKRGPCCQPVLVLICPGCPSPSVQAAFISDLTKQHLKTNHKTSTTQLKSYKKNILKNFNKHFYFKKSIKM